ncbi:MULTISPECIES: hypothetical protein [unclassified Coleofasciculus]|uniref:hypothetical protein n=1 Tax=unclassified Coleofasciculus TaxID=2692782 RepID=UPI0018810D9D|nr:MULTISPECIES: hypothetical protein [unclassified Coleofasciculus]MBE9126691.1 hypothetical protein [Coleofasciculus sp. LEGE 07081]MBE9150785.1 hypothetical protein [Coleofasciculus sp. LEGE 07092]
MVQEEQTDRQERLKKFIQAVEKAQILQNDLLTYGFDCIHRYVEDVEGDWLERWGEDEEAPGSETLDVQVLTSDKTGVDISVLDFITAFLASDYPAAVWARESNHPLAVRVQQQMETEGLPQIIAHLQECLSITDKSDRLREATDVLAGKVMGGEINRESGDEEDEIQLLDLVETLLEKLATFQG